MDINKIYETLAKEFKKYSLPIVDLIEVQTKDPFKVLVTTILSARTKDQTTSVAAARLFKTVNNAEDLEKLSVVEIEKLIAPVGFFHNKAKYLKKLPAVLKEKFQNKVPDEIEELLQLPGVGRKTANLVRTIAFRKPGICVDVHVHRISNRLGLVKTKTPLETEMELRKILPLRYWIDFNSYLVAFGQNHCYPRNPKCSTCPIYDECERVEVETKFKKTEEK